MRKLIVALGLLSVLAMPANAGATPEICVSGNMGYSNYVYLSRVSTACLKEGRCVNTGNFLLTGSRPGYRCAKAYGFNIGRGWCLKSKNSGKRIIGKRKGNVLYFN